MSKFPLRIQFFYIFFILYFALFQHYLFPCFQWLLWRNFCLLWVFLKGKNFLWKIKRMNFIQPITCSFLPLQFLLSNLAHLQFLLASDTIFIDRPRMLMDFSLPYAVKLNSVSKSIRKADKYQLHKKTGQATTSRCQMLARICHTLELSLQGAWGLPGEFSELGIAVIFIWLMPHVGQGIKDLIAKVPLTSHE